MTDNPIAYLPDDEPDFKDDLRWARRQPAYWAEKLKLDVADGIAAELERQQVSRAELARRMGTSAPFITKILRGHHNWSLETLAKAGAALGQQWLLVSAPMDATARVFTRLEFPGVGGVIGGSVDEEGLLEGDWSPAASGTADSTAAEREEQDDEHVFVAA